MSSEESVFERAHRRHFHRLGILCKRPVFVQTLTSPRRVPTLGTNPEKEKPFPEKRKTSRENAQSVFMALLRPRCQTKRITVNAIRLTCAFRIIRQLLIVAYKPRRVITFRGLFRDFHV